MNDMQLAKKALFSKDLNKQLSVLQSYSSIAKQMNDLELAQEIDAEIEEIKNEIAKGTK